MNANRVTQTAAGGQRLVAWGGFFLSGFAALVYEVCWIRQASLVFGSTTQAVSTVLAVFFLGFALGSYYFGRQSLLARRPLLWVAALELTLAATAVATLPAFQLADRFYGWAYRATGGDSDLMLAVRVVATAGVMFIPTFCMGGTLPLVCRHFVALPHRIARITGQLYGLNTLGAAAGAAVAGGFLIPSIGLQKSILLAATLNVLVAAFFWLVGRSQPVLASPTKQASPAGTPGSPAARWTVMVLFFAIGMAALANEVLWTRFLALLLRTTVYTYVITLSITLMGIAVGSLIASCWFDQSHKRAFWLGLLQVVLGLVVLTTLLLPPESWRTFGAEHLLTCVLLLAPAAVLSGMAFPLAVRMVTDEVHLTATYVGRLSAINTMGGIVGSMLMGFVLLPKLGLQASLLVSTGVSILGGMVTWLVLDRGRQLGARVVLASLACIAWLALPVWLGTRLPSDFLAPRTELVDFREGTVGNVAVVKKQGVQSLEIDRWWQGSQGKGHQIMAAHIPMLLHPGARQVIVVGGGLGQTAGRFLHYDIEQLDCVEIEPAVFELVREHFDSQWMNDRRTRLLIEDGRNHLVHTDARYDIISLELGQVFRPGVAAFYTADFYRTARKRLARGGLLCQFVPAPFFDVDEFRSVVATFSSCFPHCYLWYNTAELLLIGSLTPLEIDRASFAKHVADQTIADDLQYSHWGGPEQSLDRWPVLLSCFLAGSEQIAEFTKNAPLYRDDRPLLEYRVGKLHMNEINELEISKLLGRHLSGWDAIVAGEVSTSTLEVARPLRRQHLGDLVASGYLRSVESLKNRGDLQAMVRLLEEAQRWNPGNLKSHRLLGDALVTLGKFEPALSAYDRALEIEPAEILAERGRAVALHRLGRLPDAVEAYQAVLAIEPGDAEIHNNLGAAFAQQEDMQAALVHFRRAVEIEPGFADARKNLRRALTSGRPQSAEP